jgi:hypothetical protein
MEMADTTLIKEFEGYTITKDGIVADSTGKQLKHMTEKKTGYKYIVITCDGKKKKRMIYRLLAEAFIPNPNNYKYIRYINGVDNDLANIEWYTTANEDNSTKQKWIQKRTIADKDVFIVRWKERVNGVVKQKSKLFKTEELAKAFIDSGKDEVSNESSNEEDQSSQTQSKVVIPAQVDVGTLPKFIISTLASDKVTLVVNNTELFTVLGEYTIIIKATAAIKKDGHHH